MKHSTFGFAALALVASLAPALGAGELVVGQKDKQFSQAAVTVKNGDKVRFMNDDDVAHNIVVRDPGGATKMGVTQKPGEHTDVSFDKAGTFNVRCGIHPKMKMTVSVN